MIAQTPEMPYFEVIFTSVRTDGDGGYEAMAIEIEKLAAARRFFRGESAWNELGITVSYWE
jgi:hypothetical protein